MSWKAAVVVLFLLLVAGILVYAIRRLLTRRTATLPQPVPMLSAEERRVLEELVKKSQHGGADVAVEQFESHLRRLGLDMTQVPLLIKSLQIKDLITADTEVSWDSMNNRTINTPVYRVNETGYAECAREDQAIRRS